MELWYDPRQHFFSNRMEMIPHLVHVVIECPLCKTIQEIPDLLLNNLIYTSSEKSVYPKEISTDFSSLSICPPIYLYWDFRNFWHSPVWNIQLDIFPSLNWEKIPVWNIKLAKSKIPVRVIKNVISKWTKMEFPWFPFLWFTAVGVVNPPDQKLVMYISVNCKKGIDN